MIPRLIPGEFSLSISLNCSPVMDLSVEEWTYQPCVEFLLIFELAASLDWYTWRLYHILGVNRETSTVIIYTFLSVYISYQNGFASYPYHYMKPLTLKVTDYGLVSPSALLSPWSFIFLAEHMNIACIVFYLNSNYFQPVKLSFYLKTLVHPFTGRTTFFLVILLSKQMYIPKKTFIILAFFQLHIFTLTISFHFCDAVSCLFLSLCFCVLKETVIVNCKIGKGSSPFPSLHPEPWSVCRFYNSRWLLPEGCPSCFLTFLCYWSTISWASKSFLGFHMDSAPHPVRIPPIDISLFETPEVLTFSVDKLMKNLSELTIPSSWQFSWRFFNYYLWKETIGAVL